MLEKVKTLAETIDFSFLSFYKKLNLNYYNFSVISVGPKPGDFSANICNTLS